MLTRNPERRGLFDGFGHDEDELAKFDGIRYWLDHGLYRPIVMPAGL